MGKLNNTKELVRKLLEDEPETRGNDKLLTVRLLQRFYNCIYIRDILKPGVPSLESIRRSRQKLQEEGEYLPPAIIFNVREIEQDIYREFARE